MAHLNFLEQFESVDGAEPLNPRMQDLPGYDAGYEAGLSDAAQQNGQHLSALVDRLSEMRFGYAEAQQEMMRALTPFVSALADQILPVLSDDLTRAHIKEVLLTAAQESISSPIALTFHPDTAKLVKEVLLDVVDVEVHLSEDTTLGLQEIYIGSRDTETQLDVSGLIVDIRSALNSISAEFGGVAQNG